jgi:ATP-binding cassette subfamily C (CFTR/MRP) protein 1
MEDYTLTSILRPDTDSVLKGISISIQPRQHIAVCGRSGSGKTTLVLSLLQMIDVKEGKVEIDNVDLSAIRQSDICSRINVIPQDPFLLPGTVRLLFRITTSSKHSNGLGYGISSRIKVA